MYIFSKETNSVVTDNFSEVYPFINHALMVKDESIESRNGLVKEFLAFKTQLTNPYKRLTGCLERDSNVFFLIAEAIWIFTGRCDVAFLDIFNSRMKNYSDDGVVFHAPYGWRIRKQGLASFIPNESNKHQLADGIDQLYLAIKMLDKDNTDRRAVLQIWNAELDLDKQSKDLPCNDFVFLKVRDGKLTTSIANRSNDLHWGLTTNIFQFSYLSEMISICLDIPLGLQTHNSDSLHVYLNGKEGWEILTNLTIKNNNFKNLYDYSTYREIDFRKFVVDETPLSKLTQLSNIQSKIIRNILEDKYQSDTDFSLGLFDKSRVLWFYYKLLGIYCDYKKKKPTNQARIEAIREILNTQEIAFETRSEECFKYDICFMALNFFCAKIDKKSPLSTRDLELINMLQETSEDNIGKL